MKFLNSLKQSLFPESFSERKKQEVAGYLFLSFCMFATGAYVSWVMSHKLDVLLAKLRFFTIGMLITALGAFFVSLMGIYAYQKAKSSKSFTELLQLKRSIYLKTIFCFLLPAILGTSFLSIREMLLVHSVLLVSALSCYLFEWKPLKKLEKNSK